MKKRGISKFLGLTLIGGLIYLITRKAKAADVAPPSLTTNAATISPGVYRHPYMSGWEVYSPSITVPVNVPVTLAPDWKNVGVEQMWWHVEMTVNGQKLDIVTNVRTLANPGETISVNSSPFTPLAPGSYVVVASILNDDNVVLDSTTYTITAT